MSQTGDDFAVYTASEMRECEAKWQKKIDELKAEVERLKTILSSLEADVRPFE